jgi:spore maturation protein SpmA
LVDFTKGNIEIGLPAIKALMKINKQEYEAKGDLLKTVVVSNSSFSMIMAETIRLIGDGLPLKLEVFTTVPDALKALNLADHLERIITLREQMLLGGDTTYL